MAASNTRESADWKDLGKGAWSPANGGCHLAQAAGHSRLTGALKCVIIDVRFVAEPLPGARAGWPRCGEVECCSSKVGHGHVWLNAGREFMVQVCPRC